MFRCTHTILRRRVMSAYSLFMIDTKNDKVLSKLAVPQRGKLLAKMYRQLSTADLTALKKRAAVKHFKPRPRRTGPREPSPYMKFIGKHMGKTAGAPTARMRSVAKLWKSAKKAKALKKAQRKNKVIRKRTSRAQKRK